MKLTLLKVCTTLQGLDGLAAITLDEERRGIVAHAYKRLVTHYESYEVQRIELTREHRCEDEEGGVIYQNPDAPINERVPKWKNTRAWEDALKGLQATEVEVELKPLKRKLLKRLNLAANIEINLDPILEPVVEPIEPAAE